MKKIKHSMAKLVKQNKEEILKDKVQIEKIEKRIEERLKS